MSDKPWSLEEKRAFDRARLKARMLGNVGGAVLQQVMRGTPLTEGYGRELELAANLSNDYVEMLLRKCGL